MTNAASMAEEYAFDNDDQALVDDSASSIATEDFTGFCESCGTDLSQYPLSEDNLIICSCGDEYTEAELGLDNE